MSVTDIVTRNKAVRQRPSRLLMKEYLAFYLFELPG